MPPKKKSLIPAQPIKKDDDSSSDSGSEVGFPVTGPKPIPFQNIDTLMFPDNKFGCSFLLLGSTRSGKSTIINYLHDKYFKKYITVLMSNSLQSDAYKPLKKHCVLSDWYHSDVLKEMYHINHETNNHYQFCCIIDDCTHVRYDKQYQRLLTIYRNSRMSCIVSAQNLTMFDSTGRTNINFVLLGRLNNTKSIETVIKEYLLGYFPRNIRMIDKVAMYQQLTDDHHWLVLDNITGAVFRTKLTPQQVMNA
jgi:hypothetical protein